MKKLKITFVTIALSMLAMPLAAEVPVEVQKRLRKGQEVAQIKKAKASKKDKTSKKDKDRTEKGKGHASKGKGQAAKGKEHASKGADGRAKGKEHASKGADGRAKGKEHASKGDVTAPKNADRAPSKDWGERRLSKERLKHLRRLAQIERLGEVAQRNGNTRLRDRVLVLRGKEDLRFERTMKRINESKRLSKSANPDTGS